MRLSTSNESRRSYSGDPRLSVAQSNRFSNAMDQSFRAQWRSDTSSVIIYCVTMVIIYTITARAIASGQLGFGYILLPWIVEYLLIAWIGVLLARTWVKEPIFAAISGRVGIALAWTIALVVPYVAVFAWQAVFGLDPVAGSLSLAWERLVGSGMMWACVVVTAGLLLDTVRDVSAWRSSGGAFVWPATHRFAFRVAAMLAICLATPFVIWLLAVSSMVVGGDAVSGEFQLSWILFSMLLAADLLVLIVGTWLHRRAVRRERLAATSEAET